MVTRVALPGMATSGPARPIVVAPWVRVVLTIAGWAADSNCQFGSGKTVLTPPSDPAILP